MSKTQQVNKKRQSVMEAFKKLTDEQKAKLAENLIVFTVDGLNLTANNVAFLAYQNEKLSFSIVGGYKQWLSTGRQVRKGEKGYYIFVPRFTKDDSNQKLNGFIMVSVFDITQTDLIEITST